MLREFLRRTTALLRRQWARSVLARHIAEQPNLECLLAAIQQSQHPLTPVIQQMARRLYSEVPKGITYNRQDKVVELLLHAVEYYEEEMTLRSSMSRECSPMRP